MCRLIDRGYWRSIPNIPFFYVAYRGWSHWRGESRSLLRMIVGN